MNVNPYVYMAVCPPLWGGMQEKSTVEITTYTLSFRLNPGMVQSYTCMECLNATPIWEHIDEFTSPVFSYGVTEVPDAVMRWLDAHARLHSIILGWAWKKKSEPLISDFEYKKVGQ